MIFLVSSNKYDVNFNDVIFLGLLQATSNLEHQATESSACERNTATGLSTQGEN